MDSVTEQQRKFHEEIDRLERAAALKLQHAGKTQKEIIFAEHQAKELLDRLQKRSTMLMELYQDKDESRHHELETITGPNAMSIFYERLAAVKDYHRRFPNEVIEAFDMDIVPAAPAPDAASSAAKPGESTAKSDRDADFPPPPSSSLSALNAGVEAGSDEPSDTYKAPAKDLADYVRFSDEESFGKYLDLHNCFIEFVNIKGIERIDYVKYLELYDQLFDIPKALKQSGQYKTYLVNLKDYLLDFHVRIRPLYDIENDLKGQLETFESEWKRGIFIGWSTQQVEDANGAAIEKSEGVYCAACEKWFAKQTLYNAHLPGKKHIKASQKKKAESGDEPQDADNSTGESDGGGVSVAAIHATKLGTEKEVAATEAVVYRLSELLGEQRESTRMNVERKQALTADELLGENDEEDDNEPEDAEDEEEKPIYNPKNLPLGWDGKPIPYWLYKLHGLNLEFKCEICGNATYRGPKIFQRHFQEWRHAHGMRLLGIPNNAAFQNVTQIEDAMSLWKKIQAQKKTEKFQPDQEEEYEDSAGNVIKKKVYEDLRREGLL